jgi:hypothetical protein
MGDQVDQMRGRSPAEEASTSIKPRIQGVGARSGKVLRNQELRISIGDDSDVGLVQVPLARCRLLTQGISAGRASKVAWITEA